MTNVYDTLFPHHTQKEVFILQYKNLEQIFCTALAAVLILEMETR